MIPLELRQLTQVHGSQRGTDHPSPWSQDGPDQEHLSVTPYGAREQRRERLQQCDNVGGQA